MAYDRKSVIEKLKKLRAKADSAAALGSEAEANTFAEAIQCMLAEYKVAESEISPEDEEKDPYVKCAAPFDKYGIPYKRRESPWMQQLATIVANAHYCRMLFATNCNLLWFAGRQSEAEVAGEVFCKLANVAESLADKEYVNFFHECRRAGDVRKARGYRGSFLLGFVGRMAARYQEHTEALRSYFAHNKVALAVIKDDRKKLNDWVSKSSKLGETKKVRPSNWDGYVDGSEQASQVKLSTAREIG